MSAYTTVKDKLQDTAVYVTMHHCRWCRDISLAHLQTKQRDKEQQCHSNQIKYVLSTEVSRKNRPEHYLDNTVKTGKLTILWVGAIPDSHFDEPAYFSIFNQWAFIHAFSLTIEVTILPNSWCKAAFVEMQILKKAQLSSSVAGQT